MKLKNVRLVLGNVARTTNSKTLDVNGTGKSYKRDENGKMLDEIEHFYVDCACRNGDSIKIKFPIEIEPKFNELTKLIENDYSVSISFTGLKLTAYALRKADGNILSGVSGKAQDFTIEKSYSDDDILDVSELDFSN